MRMREFLFRRRDGAVALLGLCIMLRGLQMRDYWASHYGLFVLAIRGSAWASQSRHGAV